MGAFVGLGNVASDLSQATREKEAYDLKKASTEFTQRQRQQQLDIAKQRLGIDDRRVAVAEKNATLDKRLRDATEQALVVNGFDAKTDINSLPADAKERVRQSMFAFLTPKQYLGQDVVQDDDSTTGYDKQTVNLITGDPVGKKRTDTVVPQLTSRPEPKSNLTDEQALAAAKWMAGANPTKRPMYDLPSFYSQADKRKIAEVARQNNVVLPEKTVANWAHQGQMQQERFAQADKKTTAVVSEALGGLAVLHASLFGGTDESGQPQPGLESTVDVLDDTKSRIKLIGVAKQMGLSSDKSIIDQLTPDLIGNLYQGVLAGQLTQEEYDYFAQMQRAASAIGGLRNITGKMRPTEALIQRLVRELPDPIGTNSGDRARQKLALIAREIKAYRDFIQQNSAKPVEQQPTEYSGTIGGAVRPPTQQHGKLLPKIGDATNAIP